MTQLAVTIRHQTRPGFRDEVRNVWERHMAPAVDSNPGHLAYFYCFDNVDPDVIMVFQVYDSVDSSSLFLATDAYAAYLRDVEPLLVNLPQVSSLTPVWMKPAVWWTGRAMTHVVGTGPWPVATRSVVRHDRGPPAQTWSIGATKHERLMVPASHATARWSTGDGASAGGVACAGSGPPLPGAGERRAGHGHRAH